MSVNTSDSYIIIGTQILNNYELENKLILPVPTQLPSSNQFFADAGRNAGGTMMIQEIGRTQYTTSIRWATLPSRKWWEINRWFEKYGYVFYMKYFSHTEGRVKIQRFYRGSAEQGEPSPQTIVEGGYIVPLKYKNCGFNVIDMGEDGEDDVITVYEVTI